MEIVGLKHTNRDRERDETVSMLAGTLRAAVEAETADAGAATMVRVGPVKQYGPSQDPTAMFRIEIFGRRFDVAVSAIVEEKDRRPVSSIARRLDPGS